MPIPKWCDRKSIRTVKSGKARVLVCCPKKKWKAGRCAVGTREIDVRSEKLIKGAKKEHREHPWTSMKQARRIARDHLVENPKAYGEVFVATAVDSRGREHGRWEAATVPAAMHAAEKAPVLLSTTVRGERTSDGRSWGPGRGRVEAVREGGRWLRY